MHALFISLIRNAAFVIAIIESMMSFFTFLAHPGNTIAYKYENDSFTDYDAMLKLTIYKTEKFLKSYLTLESVMV